MCWGLVLQRVGKIVVKLYSMNRPWSFTMKLAESQNHLLCSLFHVQRKRPSQCVPEACEKNMGFV
jgi:hypothetical protein